jgi:hypothetical protein
MRNSRGRVRRLGRSARIGGRVAVIETGWENQYIYSRVSRLKLPTMLLIVDLQIPVSHASVLLSSNLWWGRISGIPPTYSASEF